jgi:sialate O-acetylesterase
MQFAVGGLINATEEIAEAGDPAYLRVRITTVGYAAPAAPASALAPVEQPWTPVNSTTIGSTSVAFGVFSAACWLTGRDLFNGLGRATPLGLVASSVSGTPIQAWAPAAALAACAQPPNDPYKTQASALWNGMVAPWSVGPFSFLGAIWWQGEANAAVNQTAYYACQLPALISSWRDHLPGLWFGVVQLQAFSKYAAHNDTYDVPWLRDAQAAALALPNVSLATAIDLGDPTQPCPPCNIHNRNKQPAGARLAAGALALRFGRALPHASPRATGGACSASGGSLRVVAAFDGAARAAGGLALRPRQPCPPAVPPQLCSGLGILGSDGVWRAADDGAAVGPEGDSVAFAAPAPEGVRPVKHGYAWSAYPVPTIFTEEGGLPALPWLLDC